MSTVQVCEPVLFRGVRVFDGVHEELSQLRDVYLENRRIADPSTRPDPDARVIDAEGRVLMPGLTDAHVHLFGIGSTQAELLLGPTGLGYYNALAEAAGMLMRGFTTVRDMGGDTGALKKVLDAGLFPGPRIYPSQATVSQTSGHGDFSAVHETPLPLGGTPSRAEDIGFTRIADGRPHVLTAVREQLKKGASQIKVMAGGGAASSYDPLDVVQYTRDELRAAVQAAQDWGTYVAVHVYNTAGVRRAVEAGVRSIEHGHLADEETIALLAEHDVWLSTQPFLESDHVYASPDSAAKNREICDGVARTLEWARRFDVRLAFGTDLLLDPAAAHRQIDMFVRLNTEFGFDPVEALRTATSGNAELFATAGARDPYRDARLGVIDTGAWADVLLVEGDPTQDLSILADPAHALAVIVKDGRVYKDTLTGAGGS